MKFWGNFIFAYISSRVIFNQFDFYYDIFNEPLNISKLLIDVGVFISLYLVSAIVLDRLFPEKEGKSPSEIEV
ncbi:hypothetical protein [Pleionea sediminis]|uniref:hypothetical protein n=1 Tax=Pleionea sediminis TaxID=2569479 RepID=UPI001185DE46|nr:hypothetical protein [Pleionea sediminis]